MKTGIQLIEEERQRQIEKEGWTAEHDDQHTEGQMAAAASCYAKEAVTTINWPTMARFLGVPRMWPWHAEWWKPHNVDPKRDLIRAGALIAAEIDRLQRLS